MLYCVERVKILRKEVEKMSFQKFLSTSSNQLSGIDRASCSCKSCPCNRSAKTGDSSAGASGDQNSSTKGSKINSSSSSAC